MPETNQIETMINVQPETAFPNILTNKAYINTMKLKNDIKKPNIVIIFNGLKLNEVIPSIANLNIFINGYFDSPATLSLRL